MTKNQRKIENWGKERFMIINDENICHSGKLTEAGIIKIRQLLMSERDKIGQEWYKVLEKERQEWEKERTKDKDKWHEAGWMDCERELKEKWTEEIELEIKSKLSDWAIIINELSNVVGKKASYESSRKLNLLYKDIKKFKKDGPKIKGYFL